MTPGNWTEGVVAEAAAVRVWLDRQQPSRTCGDKESATALPGLFPTVTSEHANKRYYIMASQSRCGIWEWPQKDGVREVCISLVTYAAMASAGSSTAFTSSIYSPRLRAKSICEGKMQG